MPAKCRKMASQPVSTRARAKKAVIPPRSTPTLDKFPVEIQIKIFEKLGPLSAACLGILCKSLWAVFSDVFQTEIPALDDITPESERGSKMLKHLLKGFMGDRAFGHSVNRFVTPERSWELAEEMKERAAELNKRDNEKDWKRWHYPAQRKQDRLDLCEIHQRDVIDSDFDDADHDLATENSDLSFEHSSYILMQEAKMAVEEEEDQML